MKYIKVFFILNILLSTLTFAQDTLNIEWEKRFVGPRTYDDGATDMVIDKEGFIYVTGITGYWYFELVTIKYDTNGELIWAKYDSVNPHIHDDIYKIGIDSENNIYVGGLKRTDFNSDYYLVKYDNDGNFIWEQSYYASQSDTPTNMVIDDEDNIILTGWATKDNKKRCLTIKYNNEGVLQWANWYNYDENSDDIVSDIVADDSSNIYLVGRSSNPTKSFSIKYNSDGNLIWAKNEDGWIGEQIKLDNDNNLYATYQTPEGLTLIKYGTKGDEMWRAGFDDPSIISINSRELDIDKFNNAYITGLAKTSVGGGDDKSEFITFKYNAVGTLEWIKYYIENEPYGGGESIEIDSSGNVIVAGYIVDNFPDIKIIKYDPLGNIINMAKYDSIILDTNSYDTPVEMLLDKEENIYVLVNNSSIYFEGGSFFTLLKYSNNPVSVNEEDNIQSQDYCLYQNYPNPFNPSTKIEYRIQKTEFVSLKVYDVLGRDVSTLVNKEQSAGSYEVQFSAGDGQGLTSGVYFYQLRSGNYVERRKMVVMK